jgi:hypothetical protein
MNTDNRGVYGSESKSFGGTFPVWKHIDNEGIEQAGGTLKVVSDFAVEYPAGTIIPIGTPVNLSNGILTILQTYELAQDIAAIDTVIKFKAAGAALPLKSGLFLMPAPATVSTTGTAQTVGTVALVDGNYEVTIVADAWGHTAKAGDIFVAAAATGSGKLIATVPTGLLRYEIYIGPGATVATGASVFAGNILVDRISPIPSCVKTVLPQIKFTAE